MARMSRNQDFERPVHIQIDQKPCQIDEDDFNVLDDGILDNNSPDITSDIRHRRRSFAEGAAPFSPIEGDWQAYHYHAEPVAMHQTNDSTHPFIDQRASAFSGTSGPQSLQYSQTSIWSLNGTSGSCTPTPGYEGPAPAYENRAPATYGSGVTVSSQTTSYDGLQINTGAVFQSTIPYSTSPQSAKDWMSASSADATDFRAVPQHARPHSPVFPANTHLLRRDGIRKKNARFDIPAERNLRTIDHLINQTSDEQEIKELKQQKRLLRNRQAALDSRQRKKQHTERLEEEKKHYTTLISDLEDALGDFRLREAEWSRERERWNSSQQQCQRYIDNLVVEKEELVRCHTIESTELRKRNSILNEQIQRMESTAMSTAPSSTGFSADFSDFDHLTMNSSSWDNFSLAHDFSIENEPATDNSITVPSRLEKSMIKDEDKSATSGFLLMLLLCGAWAASRSSSSSTNLLPKLPEDMRVASATVLEHIYKDAGIQPHPHAQTNEAFVDMVKSSPRRKPHKTTLSAYEFASLSNTPLDSLQQRLTAPSEAQMREQAFTLNPSQYNDLSSDGNFDQQKPGPFKHRRNLGEALAAVCSSSDKTVAEVCTRSLMWDKIPNDVVRDFARMVAESSVGQLSQWKAEPLN